MREFLLKKASTISILLAGFSGTLLSHAQSLTIGEADLRLEATGALSYYSNPYLRDDVFEAFLPIEDSFAFIIDPTAKLEMGDEDSRYQINGSAGITIRRFDSISALNAEDLHFDLTALYRGDRSRWDLSAGTKEISLPEHHTRQANAIPSSDSTHFRWNGSYRYSPRTRFTGGINFYERSFSDSDEFNFSDHESFDVPIRFYYQLTEKLELGGGARYRERKQERFDQPSDIAWHLALDGKITNKVTADLKVGILDENGSSAKSSADGELFISARTTWQATEDANLSLNIDRDVYTTGLNDSVIRETIGLTGGWRITTKLFAQASFEQYEEDFDLSSRKDKVKRFSASLSYAPTDSQLFSSVTLSHEDNNSNQLGFDYTSFVFNWTTGWRF